MGIFHKPVWAVAGAVALGSCLLLGWAGEAPKDTEVSVEEIGSKIQIMGLLGKSLGTYVTIEGEVPKEPLKLNNPLMVDTVDGVKLDKPVLMSVPRKALEPSAGTRCKFKGYETGGFVGTPVLPDGKAVAQQPYHFGVWFVVAETP